MQGRFAEAESFEREALRLNPDDGHEPFNNLSETLARLQKWTEAESVCREAIRLKPDNPWTHYILGCSLGNQDKHVEAIAAYRESIRLNPNRTWAAHSNLGEALVEQAKSAGETPPWDEVTAEFVRAIELSKDERNLRASLATYRTLAQWDETFKRVAALQPNDPMLWIGRAQNRALTDRWAKSSAADYAKVIHKLPASYNENTEYAYLLVLLGDADGYQRFCHELVQRRKRERRRGNLADRLGRAACSM